MNLTFFLKKSLNMIDIILTNNQIQSLIIYIELLIKWNKKYNLTSITSPKQIIIRHILDSIIINKYLYGENFIDVGTGPGLPGIPLAIINPNNYFILLDSLGKRIRFLQQIQYELMLKNIKPIKNRVEQYEYSEKFDGIITRAFSSLNNTILLSKHLLKKNKGKFYALKGIIPENNFFLLSDFKINKIIPLNIPYLNEKRHLLILEFKVNK